MKRIAASLFLLLAVGCSREEAADQTKQVADRVGDTTTNVAQRIRDQFNPAVPVAQDSTPEERERERFNAEWRKLRSFQQRQRQAAAPRQDAAAADGIQFTPRAQAREDLKTMNPAAIDSLPVSVPITGDVSGPSVLRTQILLDRARFSAGVIDGRWGKNSEIAVYWFQDANGIEPTGTVDEATFRALVMKSGKLPSLKSYTVTAEDLEGPFTSIPEDMYDKAKLDCLCYENAAERLAERFHVTRELLAQLNPNVKLDALTAGHSLLVPNVREPVPEDAQNDIVRIVVSGRGWYLHGMNANGDVIFHAPTTLGNKYDPSPSEETKIVGIAFDPHFHYQPTLFAEVPDDDPEAHLQPGPNSPVGRVWMALSKPHYGIHGTSSPESIGYSSSHGCVRLTNWDAVEVARRTEKGTPVEFVDTRGETS